LNSTTEFYEVLRGVPRTHKGLEVLGDSFIYIYIANTAEGNQVINP